MSFDTLAHWPTIPADPWPKTVPLPWIENLLAKDNLPFSLKQIGIVLIRCLELEMRSAGECAAMAVIDETDRLHRFELQVHSRVHAEAAARLLTAYEMVHRHAVRRGCRSLPLPKQLRKDGTRLYLEQFHDYCEHQYLLQTVKANWNETKNAEETKRESPRQP